MSYCPWSGAKDCGCGKFPFTWNGLMPGRCEELMPLYMVNAHINHVTPARKAEYQAWVKDGMKQFENDDEVPPPAEQEKKT